MNTSYLEQLLTTLGETIYTLEMASRQVEALLELELEEDEKKEEPQQPELLLD